MKATILVSAVCLGMLSACNTMEGFGEDLQGAGSSLERSAKENNPKNKDSSGQYQGDYNDSGYNNNNTTYDNSTYQSAPVGNTY